MTHPSDTGTCGRIRAVHFGEVPSKPSSAADFDCSLAVIVGIDDYDSEAIPDLSTAVNDARRLAEILENAHGYQVETLTSGVTRERLNRLLDEEIRSRAGERNRLLFYFAGHGIALDGEDGPEGFLIPADADPEDRESFLPMAELHRALDALLCRHMLAILDCCFAGTFRWSSATRAVPRRPGKIHNERYERYRKYPAWQVLTSAAHDQKALDVLAGEVIGRHGEEAEAGTGRLHSPFAKALFASLRGEAESAPRGGVLTATELYLDLRDAVQVSAEHNADHEQTPEIWPLRKHDKGEYLFLVPERDETGNLVPGRAPDLPSAPNLTPENNPYCGLDPYPPPGVEPKDMDRGALFFGRSEMTDRLKARVEEEPLVIVLGVSGSGKSSLVNAGLLRRLRLGTESPAPDTESEVASARWHVLGPVRPGAAPLAALKRYLRDGLAGLGSPHGSAGQSGEKDPDRLIGDWLKRHPRKRLLLVVDQLEEVLTQCRDDDQRLRYIRQLSGLIAAGHDNLRIVLTLRLDFEPIVRDLWPKGQWSEPRRFEVSPMSRDELRDAIEGPANERSLFFDPPSLVQDLIDDVQQTPAALPLISFTLSELYRRSDPANRALTRSDYEKIGKVLGSLSQRANDEYDQLRSDEERRAHAALGLRLRARLRRRGRERPGRGRARTAHHEGPPGRERHRREPLGRDRSPLGACPRQAGRRLGPLAALVPRRGGEPGPAATGRAGGRRLEPSGRPGAEEGPAMGRQSPAAARKEAGDRSSGCEPIGN